MRFMVMLRADRNSRAGVMPSEQLLAALGRINEQLAHAGRMLSGAGLHPSAKGARVQCRASERTVIDGPFAETEEQIAGFWNWQCASLQAGDRLGPAPPRPDGRRFGDRDPPGLRSRGLRRRIHARIAGAGRPPAGAGRRPGRCCRGRCAGARTARRDPLPHGQGRRRRDRVPPEGLRRAGRNAPGRAGRQRAALRAQDRPGQLHARRGAPAEGCLQSPHAGRNGFVGVAVLSRRRPRLRSRSGRWPDHADAAAGPVLG